MIQIFDGVPGSGKSYHAAEYIYSVLISGKTVVTNLPLHWEAYVALAALPTPGFFRSRPGVTLRPEQLIVLTEEQMGDFFQHMPAGTLDAPVEGVFDELQNLFNSRNWAKTQKDHGETLKFISHHRHYHTNLTLITQDRGNIDKQFRVMCAHYWEHVDLQGFNLIGIPFGKVLPAYFVRKKFAGQDEKTSQKLSFVTKKPAIWKLYDSHVHVEGISLSSQVERVKLEAVKPTVKQEVKQMLKAWLVIGVVIIAFVVWVFGKAKGQFGNHAAPVAVASPQAGGLISVPSPAPVPVAAPAVHELVKAVPKLEDEIRSETLRMADGSNYRKTDKGVYVLHRMCISGIVEKMDDDMITVRKQDGTRLFVLLDGATIIPGALETSRVAFNVPVPPAPVAAPVAVHPTPSAVVRKTLTQIESERISASAHMSIADQQAASNKAAKAAKTPTGTAGTVAQAGVVH